MLKDIYRYEIYNQYSYQSNGDFFRRERNCRKLGLTIVMPEVPEADIVGERHDGHTEDREIDRMAENVGIEEISWGLK